MDQPCLQCIVLCPSSRRTQDTRISPFSIHIQCFVIDRFSRPEDLRHPRRAHLSAAQPVYNRSDDDATTLRRRAWDGGNTAVAALAAPTAIHRTRAGWSKPRKISHALTIAGAPQEKAPPAVVSCEGHGVDDGIALTTALAGCAVLQSVFLQRCCGFKSIRAD